MVVMILVSRCGEKFGLAVATDIDDIVPRIY
jgi:hypothetical protein